MTVHRYRGLWGLERVEKERTTLSGLAQRMGLSRASVWRRIRSLRGIPEAVLKLRGRVWISTTAASHIEELYRLERTYGRALARLTGRLLLCLPRGFASRFDSIHRAVAVASQSWPAHLRRPWRVDAELRARVRAGGAKMPGRRQVAALYSVVHKMHPRMPMHLKLALAYTALSHPRARAGMRLLGFYRRARRRTDTWARAVRRNASGRKAPEFLVRQAGQLHGLESGVVLIRPSECAEVLRPRPSSPGVRMAAAHTHRARPLQALAKRTTPPVRRR